MNFPDPNFCSYFPYSLKLKTKSRRRGGNIFRHRLKTLAIPIENGSQSLTSILSELKRNSSGRKIVRSHLPSRLVLELRLGDSKEFYTRLHAKLKIVPGSSPEKMDKEEYKKYLHENANSHLEKMAAEEHAGWMNLYLSNSWTSGSPRNDYKKNILVWSGIQSF